MLLYAIENYVSRDTNIITSSSEDALYVLENLYNIRPSKPFRFTGIGSIGTPEWICVEFDAPARITLAAVFNHNLTDLAAGGDEFKLKADDDCCDPMGSGCANWPAPDYEHDLEPHLVDDWNDVYLMLNESRLSWRVEVIDSTNPDTYVEIGEFFLGEYTALSTARLKPGRAESPQLYRAANVTPYGQHWTEALSHSITLNLVVTNLGDPRVVDAVRKMILDIHENNDKFVIVPNDKTPFVYYVHLENDGGFMSQVARGDTCEVTEWTFQLRTLTKGIKLL